MELQFHQILLPIDPTIKESKGEERFYITEKLVKKRKEKGDKKDKGKKKIDSDE